MAATQPAFMGCTVRLQEGQWRPTQLKTGTQAGVEVNPHVTGTGEAKSEGPRSSSAWVTMVVHLHHQCHWIWHH